MHVCTLLAVAAAGRGAPGGEARRVPRRARRRTSPSTCRRSPRAGVLETVKGPRGGYRLARPAAEITVLDVVEAIDGDEPAFRCTEIRRRGPTRGAGARVPHAVRHPPRVHPRRRGVARRAGARRRSPTSCSASCRRRRPPRSRRAPAGSQPTSASLSDVRSSRGSAAGAGALAVVGLVAAGLELALLRLLAHKGRTLPDR